MNAISVNQPWAYAVMHLGKPIINRDCHTNFRGIVAIHAGRSVDKRAYFLLKRCGYRLPAISKIPTGGIIGTVEIIDSVDDHASSWKKRNSIGYVVVNPKASKKMLSCRGKSGFWRVSETIADHLKKGQ